MSNSSLGHRAFEPLGRLTDFEGRSTPGEFWPYMLLLVAALAVALAAICVAATFSYRVSPISVLYPVVLILILMVSAAVVRRLHDVGWSGRWMLAYVLLVTVFIGSYFYWRYVLLLQPTTNGRPHYSGFIVFPMLLALPMNLLGLLIFVLCLLPSAQRPGSSGDAPNLDRG